MKTSRIDRILSDKNTRIIPCITRKYALDTDSINIKTKIDEFRSIEESLRITLEILEGKKHNNQASLPEETEINLSSRCYSSFFTEKWKDSFDCLKDKSFITPRNVEDITNEGSGWKKDASSGRNYYFIIDSPLQSVINKGADLLKGDKFREYPKNYFAPPMIGSETLSNLEKEYLNARFMQEISLQLQGRTTYAPNPICLNELNNFVLESGKVVPFIEYLNEARKSDAVFFNILKSLFRAGVDCMAVPKGHEKKPFEWAVSKYLEKLGPHGTYLYSIEGLNTRIIDSKNIGKEKLEEIISKQYPECGNAEQICCRFMERTAEYYGIALGSGMTYKSQSECLLVDTTLGGVTMDIGDLEINANQEAYINAFLSSKSTSKYFCSLLGMNEDKFINSFEKYFIKTFFDYIHKSSGLIENAKLKRNVCENIISLQSDIDELIKMDGLPLREKFVPTNM